MRKLILGVLALLALTVGMSYATDLVSSLYQFVIPASYGSGAADTFGKWSIASRSLSETAAAKVAFSGKGALKGVCATTATDEDAYVDIFDKAAVTGITAGATGKDHLVAVRAKVLAATSRDSGKESCEWFERPIPFTTGLTHINSTANMRASLIFDKVQQ